MRRIVINLIVLLAFSVTGAYAGSGHSHSPKTEKITESQAGEQAMKLVAGIVKKGKLDASWAKVKPEKVQKKTFENGSEWVITFNNPGEKDPKKQTLYVFLSLYGADLGANHTAS